MSKWEDDELDYLFSRSNLQDNCVKNTKVTSVNERW